VKIALENSICLANWQRELSFDKFLELGNSLDDDAKELNKTEILRKARAIPNIVFVENPTKKWGIESVIEHRASERNEGNAAGKIKFKLKLLTQTLTRFNFSGSPSSAPTTENHPRVKMILYTRENRDGVDITNLVFDEIQMRQLKKRKWVWFGHGFQNNLTSECVLNTRDAYLKAGDVNVRTKKNCSKC
jgi:hypothetical protein